MPIDLAWASLVVLGAAGGAAAGSFAALAIDRSRRGVSVVRPGSACVACGAAVSVRDNVPVVSWLVLRGRCRRCRAPIPATSFFLEAAGAATGALLAVWLLR